MAEGSAPATVTKEADDAEDTKDDKSATETAVSLVTSVVETTPMKALLTPAFTHLGAYMGECAGAWVDGLRARREKNLASHIDAVAKERPEFNPEKVTERQARLAIEWAKEAETIDPEAEKELAALWRGLLASINKNDDDAGEMLKILRELSPTQARFILSFKDGWQQYDRYDGRIDKMIQAGVFVRFKAWDFVFSRLDIPLLSWSVLFGFFGFMSADFLVLYLSTLGYESRPNVINEKILTWLSQNLLIIVLFISTIIVSPIVLRSFVAIGRIRLTSIGLALRDIGLTYFTGRQPN